MSKRIWSQADRETPAEAEQRLLIAAHAALDSMFHIADEQLEALRQHAAPMFKRAVDTLSAGIMAAQTVVQAYQYYVARCSEAGIGPEDAATAWQIHSSEAFEAQVVEAEAVGPNHIPLVDARILSRLNIPACETEPSA